MSRVPISEWGCKVKGERRNRSQISAMDSVIHRKKGKRDRPTRKSTSPLVGEVVRSAGEGESSFTYDSHIAKYRRTRPFRLLRWMTESIAETRELSGSPFTV